MMPQAEAARWAEQVGEGLLLEEAGKEEEEELPFLDASWDT